MHHGSGNHRTIHIAEAAALAAILAVTAACSSSSGEKSTNVVAATTSTSTSAAYPVTVAQALALIPDVGWNEGYITYAMSASMDKLNRTDVSGPYGGLFLLSDGIATDPDAQDESEQTALLGFDPYKVPFTITTGGQAPDGPSSTQTATFLFGSFNTDTIAKTLRNSQFTDGVTIKDGSLLTHASGSSASDYPTVGQQSVPGAIALNQSHLVIGSTTAPVTSIVNTEPDRTLAQQPELAALADCLGPTTFGLIGSHIFEQVQNPSAPAAAVGLTPPSDGKVTFRLCVAAASAAAAQTMETHWVTQMRSGKFPLKNTVAWSYLLTNPGADISSTSLRVVELSATLTSNVTPETMISEYLAGAFATPLGIPQGE